MSAEQDKIKHSRRLLKDDNTVVKQLKIARATGAVQQKLLDQPHRLAKHHAMDCGNPGCGLCGNPRHLHKDGLTLQERRMFQEVDAVRKNHSNGILPPTEPESKEIL